MIESPRSPLQRRLYTLCQIVYTMFISIHHVYKITQLTQVNSTKTQVRLRQHDAKTQETQVVFVFFKNKKLKSCVELLELLSFFVYARQYDAKTQVFCVIELELSFELSWFECFQSPADLQSQICQPPIMLNMLIHAHVMLNPESGSICAMLMMLN